MCGWRGRTGLYTPIYNEPHESAGKHMICAWGVVVTGFGAPQQPLQLEACPPHPPLCWRLVHVRMCVCVCVFHAFSLQGPGLVPGDTGQNLAAVQLGRLGLGSAGQPSVVQLLLTDAGPQAGGGAGRGPPCIRACAVLRCKPRPVPPPAAVRTCACGPAVSSCHASRAVSTRRPEADEMGHGRMSWPIAPP